MKKFSLSVTDSEILKRNCLKLKHSITVDDFKFITNNHYAHSTCLAMTKDWNLFIEFCQLKHVAVMPASTTVVRLFLEHVARQRKYATVRRYSITISVMHQLCGKNDPTNHNQVRKVLMQLRLDKHGDEKQATTFTIEHLNELTKQMAHSDVIKDIRDLAIYYVMFECALKRGELKRMTVDLITDHDEHLSVLLGDAQYQLSTNGSNALQNWLSVLDDDSGFIFRAINRHGTISDKALDDSSIYRIFRNAGERLGEPQLKFSGQSTRIGAVKELAKQGYKAKDIQKFGRWLSPAMPYQYLGDKNTAEREKIRFLTIKPWE